MYHNSKNLSLLVICISLVKVLNTQGESEKSIEDMTSENLTSTYIDLVMVDLATTWKLRRYCKTLNRRDMPHLFNFDFALGYELPFLLTGSNNPVLHICFTCGVPKYLYLGPSEPQDCPSGPRGYKGPMGMAHHK